MVPPIRSVPAFAGVAAILVAIPGPSVLFTVSRALTGGRRTALWNVVGNELGLIVQVIAVAFGLGALIERSVEAFTAVKLAGAVYLAILLVILPQFTSPSAGDRTLQLLVLGLVFPVIALVLDGIWALAAGTLGQWLARSPRRLAAIGGVGGLVMIGLGVSVAATGRKD